MSDLNLKIDMDRVQSSVQAAVRPAVEEALKSVDVAGMIATALTRTPASDHSDYMLRMMGHSPRPSIDRMVEEAVSALCREFVQKHLAAQKAVIEEALMQSLKGSASKLANAFAKAATKAFKDDDWSFDLSVAVKATEPERDYD